jgi:pimeloyl-ACP methyl ester carboxylesterase
MTVVLVHGNPETDAIWGPLRAELGRGDVVALSPPGFGAPVPAGFGATMTDYRDWLIDQLVAIGEPVDLVGHDWGGGHVVNVAMARPDLLRSWASDVLGCYAPDYLWDDLAQVWQTPGDGEKLVETMMGGTVEDRAERMREFGIPHDVAVELAAHQGPEMGRCILALYRSAAQPVLAQAGQSLPSAAARPGLAISATEDYSVGSPEGRRQTAEQAGARLVELDGLGHWWMLQDPARGAEMLSEFWSSLPA